MDNTLTFVASRGKALRLLLLSICCVALGAWGASESPVLGWLMVALFGLGILVSLLLMFLPSFAHLRLDEEGFEVGSIFRSRKYRWSDVVDFRIESIPGANMIAIIFHPEYKQQPGRTVASTLSGIDAAIPDQYNATLEQILEALTDWRQCYGQKGAQPAIATDRRLRRVPRLDGGLTRELGDMMKALFHIVPWWLVALKLAVFLSTCGGPLVLIEWLKVHIDQNIAIAIGCFPSLAMMFGVFSLRSGPPDRWDDWMISLGLIGAVALIAMNIFGLYQLTLEPARADSGLIKFGIAIGLLFIAYYAHASYRFFRLHTRTN
jgi:Bacterial PH domain